MVREDRRIGVELTVLIALEPQANGHVQLTAELEREAVVGHLL